MYLCFEDTFLLAPQIWLLLTIVRVYKLYLLTYVDKKNKWRF